MSARPLVSLYVLAFNHEHLIGQAIDGAFSQTYSPLEIIISDDCSTDGTWPVIRQKVASYRGPHKVIARRNATNLGIAAHINTVWQACSGEWIVASAGDDVSLPQRVERVMQAAQQYPDARMVQCWLNEVDALGELLIVNRLGVDKPTMFDIQQRLEGLGYAAHGAAMAYSRELVDLFGPLPDGVIFEDNILNVRAELLDGLLVLPEALVNHRNHAGQVTRFASGESREQQRRRLARALDSDIASTRQNAADVETIAARLPQFLVRRLREHFSARVRYCQTKRDALLRPWPARLLPLARIARHTNKLGMFRRDDLARSLLPETVYYAIKR